MLGRAEELCPAQVLGKEEKVVRAGPMTWGDNLG
jgi:hypothetical protein